MNEKDKPQPYESNSVEEHPRLIQAMEEYLAELEQGIRPDRKAFVSRFPDIADELAANLEGIDFVHGVAPELKIVEGKAHSAEPIRPLATLGDYRIVRELGRGGMGVVYEAEQLSLGRRVALKVLPFAGVLDEKAIKRFKNEARAAACLEHPHIVPVHAVCQDRGVHFFAMSLVDGLTLAQVIVDLRKQVEQGNHASLDKLSIDNVVSKRSESEFDGQWECPSQSKSNVTVKDVQAAISTMASLFDGAYFRRLAEIGIQAADALQHAHEHGIVHRDIKPGNLMIDGNRNLWVTDFGLAQFENDPGMTMTGDLLGTVRYMSPEQASGNRTHVNHLTDVYSLGVTLYELLALQPPFLGEHRVELLRKIALEEPRSPQHLNKSVPDDLATIVMKAMSKSSQDRYATAADLAADLRRWLEHRAIIARRPTLKQRLAKWSRRNRPLVGALAVATTLILCATVLIGWWHLERESIVLKQQIESERRSLATERISKQAEEQQRQRAEASEREATRQLYNADMRAGLGDWTSGNLSRLSGKLLSHTPRPGRDELRGWEWFYLLSLCHEEDQTLNHRFDTQVVACISPDGKYIASAGVDTTIKIFENKSWQQLVTWISPNDGIAMAPSWSPDSQQLAWGTADEGEVYVMDMLSKKVVCLKGHTSSVLSITWCPEGKRLASGGVDKNICIWDLATHSVQQILNTSDGEVSSLAWHPDDSQIAAITGSELLIVDSASGEHLHKSDILDINQIAWTTDGSELVVGTLSGNCIILNARDFSRTSRWKAHDGPINGLACDPLRRKIVTAGSDHLIHVWDGSTADCELTLRGHLKQVQSVSCDRSGQTVVSSGMDGLVKVWKLPSVGQPRRQAQLADRIHDIYWSKSEGVDGRLLATTTKADDQTVVILDVESGIQLRSWNLVTVPTENLLHIAWSSNQSNVASSNGGILNLHNPTTHEIDFTESAVLSIRALAWSPDSQLLAIAGSGEPADGANLAQASWIHIFDAQERKRIHKFRHGSSRVDASAVAWSPDGTRIVSGDMNGLAEIRDVSTNRKLASASLHTSTINALSWSPDGRRIASGSADRSIRIWDPNSGEELLKFESIQSEVKRICWSSNGQQLAAATSDGSILIWDASKGFTFVNSDDYFVERAQNLVSRAVQLLEKGSTRESVAACHEAIEESISKFGDEHRQTLWSMSKLALVLYDAGREDEAKEIWTKLLKTSAEKRDDYSGVINFVLRRANSARMAGRMEEAQSLIKILSQADVRDHYFLNKLAWELANCPDSTLRNPRRAVELATNASQLKPMGAQILNTLGVAHYRAGNWQAAIDSLLKSEEITPNKRTSYNAFFLAMAYWQVHDKQSASDWFNRGVDWMESNRSSVELNRIRTEAGELIGAVSDGGSFRLERL